MENKRYILWFAGAIVWIVLVWIPFYVSHTLGLFLSAVYCTVAACLIPVFIAVRIGDRRRQVQKQKTEERNKKIASAFQRARMNEQNKLETQKYIEASRNWRLRKAKNLEASGRYEEAARLYNALEMHEKADKCVKLARTSSKI